MGRTVRRARVRIAGALVAGRKWNNGTGKNCFLLDMIGTKTLINSLNSINSMNVYIVLNFCQFFNFRQFYLCLSIQNPQSS